MANCPNKSFKSSPDQLFTDWEFLVGRFGEDQAYAYWLANGEVIPNPNEVEALTDVVISNYATQGELTKGYNFLTDSKGNLMPSKYVEQFTASLTKLLFEIQKERKLSVKNTFKKIEEELTNFYEFHSSIKKKSDINEDTLDAGAFNTVKQNQLVASYYKHILDNKDRYFDMVIDKVEAMGYVISKNKSELKENVDVVSEQEDLQLEAEEEYLAGEQVEHEKRFNEGDSNIHQDPYEKLSPIIKRFISFIPAEEDSVLGLETYVSGSQIYSTLLSLTSNGEYSYEEIVQVLKDNVNSKPFLQGVLDLLQEEKNQDLKIAFAKHFRHTYQTSRTLQIEDNNGRVKGKVIETNRTSQIQLIKEQWLDNSKLSDIFKGLAEGTFLDKQFVEGKLTKQWNKAVESKDVDDLGVFLDMIGIVMSKEALEHIKTNSKNTELKLGWDQLFDSKLKNAVFSKIFEYVKNINPETNIDEENPLANENFITKLASVEALFRDSDSVTDNYRDGKGRSRYSHIQPTWIMNRYYQIKDNKDKILDSLASLPFGQHSYYIGKLKTNDTFRKNFSVDLFDTTSNNDERKTFDEMSKREKLITQINLFIHRQTGESGEKLSTFLTPSKSDKATLHTMTAIRYNVLSNSLDFKHRTFNLNDQEVLMNIVRGEYARIKDAQKKRNEGVDFGDIVGYNPFRFYLYEGLNNIDELWTVNDRGEKELKDINDEGVSELVWNNLKQDINSQIESLRTTLTKAGVIVDNKLQKIDTDYINDVNKKGGVEYFLADYIINYNIAMANYNILFQADTAFASKKTVEGSIANMFKRLAKDVAPASKMAKFKDNAEFNHYRQIFLEDTFSKSLNIDQLKTLLGDKAEVYNEIEGTDAQEVTTLEEHIDVLYYYGRIPTDKYNALISKAKRGAELSKEELDIVLQPIKPVHVGNYVMQEYGAEVPVYIKTSSFPLVPQLVEGTEFEKLERQMRKNKIRRATFLTGAKLGAFKPIDIWNKTTDENGDVVKFNNKALTDGTINEDILSESLKNKQFLTLNRDNFGIQQDVPYDAEKNSILEGSQLAKLIFHGLKGDQKTIKQFNQLHIDITERAFKSVIDEMGYVETENGFEMKDMSKLRDMLITELKEGANTYTENDVLALELNEDQTDFKIPIWASAKSKQYESLLNSIINKRVLKTKLPGRSYVLGTEEGFKGKSSEIKYIKEDELQGTVYDKTTGLKPQRFGYRKGKKSIEESEYKALDSKEGWNKVVLPAQILVAKSNYKGKQMVGYRIPTQDLNSMSAMEVVGYLPDYMGDLLIAPKDFTKQMGSDFDIDKIYTHRWYEDYKGNKYDVEVIKREWERISKLNDTKEFTDLLELKDVVKMSNFLAETFNQEALRYSEEEIVEMAEAIYSKYPTEEEYYLKRQSKIDKNKIVDIYWNTLTKEENLESILRPLDTGSIPDAVKVIKEKQKEDIKHYLSPEYQVDNYENGNAGKFGVAATSLLSTFNSLLLAIETPITLETDFSVGDYVTNSLNLSKDTLNDRQSKASVISAFQSASVDNIKELLIKTVNYNKYTHDALSALSLLGADEKYISYFLAQPVIKQYVTEIQDMSDSYSDPMSNKQKNDIIMEKIAAELVAKSEASALANNTTQKLTADDVSTAIDSWDKSFTEQQLVFNLKGENEYNQLVLLAKFIELSRVGKEINNVIRALSPATGGIGKDRLSSTNKQSRLEEVFATEEIKGIDKLVGEIKKDRIIPSTMIGFNLEVMRKSNQMFNRYFKINDIQKQLEDLVKDNRLTSKALTEKEQTKMISFLRSYLFSSDLQMYAGKDVEQYRKQLLFGDNSLANRWRRFKQSNPDHFLANRIRTNISKSSTVPHTIEYKASLDDVKGDVKNIYELIEMLYSDDIYTRNLAQDTISYSYLTGGNQDSISLVKFIPISYLNALGFGDSIHKLSKQIDLFVALEQYLQNNPHHAYVVTDKDVDFDKDKKYLRLQLDEDLPDYVSYRDENKWRIYKYENYGGYNEIDKLGTYTFVETKFGKTELQSSLKSKVENKIEVAELPKTSIASKKEFVNPNDEQYKKALGRAREFYLEDWLNKNPRYFLDLPLGTNSDEAENEYERAISENRELTRITLKNYKKALSFDEYLGDWISSNSIAGKGQIDSIWSEKTHGLDILMTETPELISEVNVSSFNELLNQYQKGEYDNNLEEKANIEKFIKLHGLWKFTIDINQLNLYEEFFGKKQLNDLEKELGEEPLNKLVDKSSKHFDYKVREKYFSGGNIQSVNSVLNKIADSDHPTNTLAKNLLKYSDALDTTIELVEDDGNKWAGQYVRKDNKIYIKGDVSFSGFGVEPTLLHEIIHALTVSEMRFNRDSQAVKDIRSLYEHAKKHINTEEYGLKDEYEFVAELFTNSSFINKLKDVPATKVSKYKNLLEEFFNKVLELLGINKSQSSLYEQAYAVSSNIIEDQYNKFLLEKEYLENDFEGSMNLPIFEEPNDIELQKLIKKCK